MNLIKTAAVGVIGLMLAGGAALAQTGGSANNPNAKGNVVPAPSAGPTDPAANDNPAARAPTGGASGSASGSTGLGGAAEGSAAGGTGTSAGGSGSGGTPRVQGETGSVPGSNAQTGPAR